MTSGARDGGRLAPGRWRWFGLREGLLVLVATWCAAALLGWVGAPHEQLVGAPWESPSLARPLGTDALGRDLWARVLAAAGPSIGIGVAATGLTLGIAAMTTVLARLHRAVAFTVDVVADTIASIPPLFALLAASLLFGIGVVPATMAIACIAWPTPHRMLVATLAQLDDAPFVIASRFGGASAWAVVREHVSPRVVRLSGTLAVSSFVWSVEAEGVLGWLGRSATTMPTWGRLVADGIDALVRGAWLPLVGVSAPLVVLAMLGQAFLTTPPRRDPASSSDEL